MFQSSQRLDEMCEIAVLYSVTSIASILHKRLVIGRIGEVAAPTERRLSSPHNVSRGPCHGRRHKTPQASLKPLVTGFLTASFATRKSRVQIPSAPPKVLVRACSREKDALQL